MLIGRGICNFARATTLELLVVCQKAALPTYSSRILRWVRMPGGHKKLRGSFRTCAFRF